MRTINFRGKWIAFQNRWVYGYLITVNGQPYISHATCAVEIRDNSIVTAASEVDAATVGQYTGVNDKHGKRIYEGDIVRLSFNKNHCFNCEAYVAYNQGEWVCKSLSLEYEPFQSLLFPSYNAGLYEIEVIGNIHDNPELMKGGAK